LATQAGRDFAVDVDQRRKRLASGIGQYRHCLIHNEYTEIGDILTDLDRERMIVSGDFRNKNGPKFAIELKRIAQFSLAILPRILNCL